MAALVLGLGGGTSSPPHPPYTLTRGDPIAPLRSRGALAIARAVALLLRHHAARGARSAAETGLGLGGHALVRVGVNDDGRAVRIEHRQGTVAKRHAVRRRFERGF